jgi:hypothetical protein
MMAIEPLRFCPIEATKVLDLGRHDVLEGACKPRVKDRASKGGATAGIVRACAGIPGAARDNSSPKTAS